MINKQVLRTIQSGAEKEWYTAVTNAALYMATGGFLNEANELLKTLWKYNLDHDRTTWMADNAFEVLWYAANDRPAFVPFSKIEIDELEFEFRKYCTMADSISNTDITELLSGLDLAALGLAYSDIDLTGAILPERTALEQRPSFYAAIKNGKMPDAEMELKCLTALENRLKEVDSMANHEFCDNISLAAELAAKNNKTAIAIKMAKLWASSYHKRSLGYSFSKMANSRYLAPLLLQGIITDELNLTKEICSNFVINTSKAIDERMAKGESLVYEKLTWPELIKKLSILSIKSEPDLFDEKQKQESWIGFKPVTPEAIKAAEEKLGLKLPEDYKEFLITSNGLPEFPIVNPALIKIEEVDFLKNAYFKINQEDIFEIIKDYADEASGTIAAYVDRAICISQMYAEQEVWLIPPFKKNREWQTWFFASWIPGERRYKSFRHFIEKQIQKLEND